MTKQWLLDEMCRREAASASGTQADASLTAWWQFWACVIEEYHMSG